MRIIFFILPVWISRDLYVNLHVDMKKSNGIIVRHYQSPCGVSVSYTHLTLPTIEP